MIKKSILSVLVACTLILGLGIVTPGELAFAEATTYEVPFDDSKAAAHDPDSEKGADDSALAGLTGTMYKFATYISGLIFGVSVIMIVWAGFKYATSQGEQKTMETAKMQIITAGIGIGVALLAMVIVKVFAEIYGV